MVFDIASETKKINVMGCVDRSVFGKLISVVTKEEINHIAIKSDGFVFEWVPCGSRTMPEEDYGLKHYTTEVPVSEVFFGEWFLENANKKYDWLYILLWFLRKYLPFLRKNDTFICTEPVVDLLNKSGLKEDAEEIKHMTPEKMFDYLKGRAW